MNVAPNWQIRCKYTKSNGSLSSTGYLSCWIIQENVTQSLYKNMSLELNERCLIPGLHL